MNEQMSIFSYLKEPPKGYTAEFLIGQGFKNIYTEKPPRPGMYEWRDIEEPTKSKILEYTGDGNIHLGRLAMGRFRPCWWKEIEKVQEEEQEDLYCMDCKNSYQRSEFDIIDKGKWAYRYVCTLTEEYVQNCHSCNKWERRDEEKSLHESD